ncbi:MAG: DUF1266 domain-containing protein, partial [Helicobacteraceae bacterium]|nr:DUF1266 domain-containing protein [Helicobacteraceae bacterium]
RAFIECADRLARAIVNRRKPPFAIDEKSLKKGVLAWDAGRLVVLARMAYEKGHIEENTAQTIIKNAYEATAKCYDDWREFANGYLIGAAMNCGAARLNESYSIAKSALKRLPSPLP